MKSKVSAFIQQQHLLSHDALYIVALSGGADSVALLRVLLMLGYRVEAAHCNFHLRGDESNRDEQFVKELCIQLDVPLHLAHFDTLTYSTVHNVSIEMAARELRYRYFEQLATDIGACGICIAHHRDDSVETMLLNLLRGTGIHGLTGIKPERKCTTPGVSILRPLLCLSRLEIESWLHEIGQDYVTDSTNLCDDVVRNKIRLRLIPLLREIQPSAVESLQTTAELMGEAERIYDAYTLSFTTKAKENNSLVISDLLQAASPLCILFEWLSPYGFNPSVIRQIADSLDAQTGRHWESATHELWMDRAKLLLSPKADSPTEMRVPETGLYRLTQSESYLRVSLLDSPLLRREASCACLDAAKVQFPLTLRTPRQGDRFTPYGMKGSRLVSDFLTDLKMPLPEKRRQLLLTDAQGAILWVVGLRPAAPFCISDTTVRTLLVELQESSTPSATVTP
jgi:tRNA(Ile)-lysidine synthase